MPQLQAFFENIDFSFENDFSQKNVVISENAELTKKLENNIFIYNNKNNEQTKSSFYIICIILSVQELFELKRFIWNEDKYDLFFYPENLSTISLFYAKINPYLKNEKIESFKGSDEDSDKLKKIRKWKFETGAFWTSYAVFLKKVKKTERIEDKLVQQLKTLKTKLIAELGNDKITTVQSLIDRTLFIKFLEDNHIINSFFYNYFFNDKNLSYKELLNKKDAKNINFLYKKINEIFSNILFKIPPIDATYIISTSKYIYNAISGEVSGQLSLFDFKFDIIPIEFISHIYEVFLSKTQLEKGIFYTPPKLAQLIINDTISETGKILDPACGSGMFLILSFRKILEQNPVNKSANIAEKIAHKIKLLQKYIFGIEKENTAWRLSIFSLYLEVLKDLSNNEIKDFIRDKIEKGNDIKIFPDFSKNIIEGNSLEVKKENLHFTNQTFDYIIGNPPFFEIKSKSDEIDFINNYEIEINEKIIKAKDIIGHNQISQAFMLKIKDWSNENTKFGFILNSSNFYNDLSNNFQDFFFKNYKIEYFYELSRVKKILFKKAKENVIVAIFNNTEPKDNIIKYYPVDLELFSETFKLLIIQEDKRIDIKQKDILEKNIVLRDYLIGNEYDLKLIKKIFNQDKLNDFLLNDKRYNSFEGLKRISNSELSLYLAKSNIKLENLNKKEKLIGHEKFAKEKYLSLKKTDYYNIPYIYQPENKIRPFEIVENDGYINENEVTKENFQRTRNLFIYKNNNIILNRFGKKIDACYVKENLFFSNIIYGIKLQNPNNYNLFTAILNSDIVNYYLTLKYRKRIDGNYANLNTKAIKNIPIPKDLDEDLVAEISEISKKLTEGNLKYENDTKNYLNKLIFDLYDLDYLERQRIKDFFLENRKNEKPNFEEYIKTLKNVFELHFVNKPTITPYQDKTFGFDLSVVAIYFNQSVKKQPIAKKTLNYIITEEILKNTKENFLVLREKIIGKDCIYITKSNKCQNWTKTKAFEDGKNILKLITK